jgi:hypothetical protein
VPPVLWCERQAHKPPPHLYAYHQMSACTCCSDNAHARHCLLTVPPLKPADLEFCPDVNAGLDGDALVDALLADVTVGLRQRFNLTLHATDVLELDSSTPQKFSRWIARLAAVSHCDGLAAAAAETSEPGDTSEVL